MKNLENYDLIELNNSEMSQIEGGKWWGALIGAVVGFCAAGPVGMIAGGIAGDIATGATGSVDVGGYTVPF